MHPVTLPLPPSTRRLRVHLTPTGLFSPAMERISRALTRYAPIDSVELVKSRADADLEILYVINADAIPHCVELHTTGKRYAIVQCCVDTAGGTPWDWADTWANSALTWSYYDLASNVPRSLLYHAPLGVDDIFRTTPPLRDPRIPRVITTGHVSGPAAEEIETVWRAARIAGIPAVHVGPISVVGITDRELIRGVQFVGTLSDVALRDLYWSSEYVAALRYIEGFELPAAEGLCCGANAIMFDQPAIRTWYGALSGIRTVSERDTDLANTIAAKFRRGPKPVDIDGARAAFDWAPIAGGFWERLMYNVVGASA